MWFLERENAEWLLKCLSIGRAAENRFFFLISFSKLLSNLAYKISQAFVWNLNAKLD